MPQLVQDADFFSFEISENLSESPEGYLICHNVPFARVGTYQYMGEEIGRPERAGQVVNVYRLPKDVFSPSALKSFEGKPVTQGHPSQPLVTPETHHIYSRGHVQNVRAEGDYVVADLVITDPGLINEIKSGRLRQVSAGYVPEWVPYKDGFKQIKIKGNHVAVVERGRAGPNVAIHDSLNKLLNSKRSKKPMNKQQALAKMFQKFANDATEEEIAQVLPFITDSVPAAEPTKKESEAGMFKALLKFLTVAKDEETKEEKKAAQDDDGDDDDDDKKDKKPSMDARMSALEAGMKEIKDALTTALAAKDDTGMDMVEEILGAGTEAADEEGAEGEGDEEEGKKKEATDAAVATKLLTSLKPTLAKLSAKDQKAVKDALRAGLKDAGVATGGAYASIKSNAKAHAKAAADSQPQKKDWTQLGKEIAQQFNPHQKKQA